MNFNEKCYEVLRKVPRGKVTTYKEIARVLGSKGYRAVGNAMNKNRNKDVPCHRVVSSNGKIGGFAFGATNKIKILKKESVEVKNGRTDLNKFMFKF